MASMLNLRISPAVLDKLQAKHSVDRKEVEQCFENVRCISGQHLMQMTPLASCTNAKDTEKEAINMGKHTEKIASTDEAWETGALGSNEAHAKPASKEIELDIDESLGLQAISIRLPKQLIEAYKLIATHHGVGYQPLMRDILQRFVPEGLREVLHHHEAKAGEADNRLEEWKKAA